MRLPSGLSEEEIKRMKADAEAHANEDKKLKEEADKLNAADGMIFQTENFLKDNADKIPADKKGEVETALKDLKDAHDKKDMADIDSATEKLNNILQAISQTMYQGQGGQAGQSSNPNPNQQNPNGGNQGGNDNSGDNTTDTSYEEVK